MVYPNPKMVASRPVEISDTAENVRPKRPFTRYAINVSRPIGRLAGALDKARKSIINKHS